MPFVKGIVLRLGQHLGPIVQKPLRVGPALVVGAGQQHNRQRVAVRLARHAFRQLPRPFPRHPPRPARVLQEQPRPIAQCQPFQPVRWRHQLLVRQARRLRPARQQQPRPAVQQERQQPCHLPGCGLAAGVRRQHALIVVEQQQVAGPDGLQQPLAQPRQRQRPQVLRAERRQLRLQVLDLDDNRRVGLNAQTRLLLAPHCQPAPQQAHQLVAVTRAGENLLCRLLQSGSLQQLPAHACQVHGLIREADPQHSLESPAKPPQEPGRQRRLAHPAKAGDRHHPLPRAERRRQRHQLGVAAQQPAARRRDTRRHVYVRR